VGITGIVAAKLVELFGKPTIMLSTSASAPDKAILSGRAPENVDLLATLKAHQDLFASLGGHAQAVGGIIPLELVNELKERLRSAEVISQAKASSSSLYHTEASLEELKSLTPEEIIRFYPFGEGNPAPKVVLKDVMVMRTQLVGYDSTHLRVQVSDERGNTAFLIGFRRSHLQPELKDGHKYDLGIEIELDTTYQGKAQVMFQLLEIVQGEDGLRVR